MAVFCKSYNFHSRVTQHLVTFNCTSQCRKFSSLFHGHTVGDHDYDFNLNDRNQKLKHKLLCTRSNIRQYVKRMKYSSYKGNFIAKFSEEIDLDALREQRVKELRHSGTDLKISEIVKEILSEKCDEAISNLSVEDQRKLKIIQLEHDFLFSEGYAIPSHENMTSENWLEALNLSSKNQRLKYYIFWQRRLFQKQGSKNKKALLKSKAATTDSDENKEIKQVAMNENKILLRVYGSTIKRWLNHRLCASMQFGIPLVLDMDYGELMPNRDVKNTADQLLDLYCLNRNDDQLPFHLHFTGCPPHNPIYRNLQLFLQNDPHFMATTTPLNYTECFDKDRLVYLSPDAKQVMREFDPNAIYIIGAFNDKSTQQPISYARAKEHEIKCQRLPLDHYLKWNIGSKSLTLNQVISILQAVKNNKSWQEAFKVVPRRKYL